MSEVTGVFSIGESEAPTQQLGRLSEPVVPSHTDSITLDAGFISATYLKTAPVKGPRCIEQDDYAACFAGDLIGVDTVPFDLMISSISSGDASALASLRGYFAAAVFAKGSKVIFLITDRRAQQPIYYLQRPDGVVFSTEMSTFCRLSKRQAFNRRWLYEFMFFNVPIGGTTFLEGVKRVPAGSILSLDLKSGTALIRQYVAPFRPKGTMLRGREAYEKALAVFKARIPEYCTGTDRAIALGLSGGWDSRIVLAFSPLSGSVPIHTYTYGIPGSDDLTEARMVIKELDLPHHVHHEILFDEDFTHRLPELIEETVYLSFGTLGVARATMTYLHRSLARRAEGYPVILTGFCGDHLFRGHFNVPAVVSKSMEIVFTQGTPIIGAEPFQSAFGKDYDDFRSHVSHVLDDIQERLGEFGSPECHLSYGLYELAPKHFLGDMLMINHFSTLRVPFWDDDIIELAYAIEPSTLRFSRFLPSRSNWRRENELYACLLACNPAFAGIPAERIPLRAVTGGAAVYHTYRLFVHMPRRILARIRQPSTPPAVNWKRWITGELRPSIEKLIFSKETLIRDYVDPGFVKLPSVPNRRHWVAKLGTAELILRIMARGWRM